MDLEILMSSNMNDLLDWYQRKMLDTPDAARPGKIASVAIIGAGLMGIEIAAGNVQKGLRVLITDTNPQTLAAVPERIAAELAKYERRGGAAGTECSQAEPGNKRNAIDLIELTADEERLGSCDLILETVVENPAVKRTVYGRIEPRMTAYSILATNTSTIPVGELAADLAEPGRFCGIHFCHPVHINPLVEIIPGPRTEEATVSAAVAYARALGKMPLVVEDGPGFLINRLLLRYTDEALHLLMDGASIEQVDRAATEFGMALGPLRIMDEIGLDTSLAAGKVLLNAFPDRVARLPLLPLLVKRKQLGQKSGGGFYKYSPASPEISHQVSLGPNGETLAIIEHYAKRENPPTTEAILQRMLLAMVLEATLILREKKRLDPREIDLGMICGLGFPRNQGGLLHWADTIGAPKILKMVETLEPLGKRFQPTPLLRELAKNEGRFYE
jgi:3-hydroxyacyl-CoA dehydrogenase/enoyl-CoA hydratase/3-hydroxybutyryl-CoA epimerase/3-hydroxyacyl-CoA dehydrogenase/enoyl-CoA hydratase/3-hydroxybutyryl-CoA epimerase/enoyl-CoA isomerase